MTINATIRDRAILQRSMDQSQHNTTLSTSVRYRGGEGGGEGGEGGGGGGGCHGRGFHGYKGIITAGNGHNHRK